MASTRHSIRRRLMTMMMLTSAASVGLTSGAFILYEFLAARDDSQREIAVLARVVAANSTAALAFRAEEDAHDVLATLRTEPQIVAAALYDEGGRLFAVYPRSATAAVPPAPGANGFSFRADVLEGFQTVRERPERSLGKLFISADMQPVYERFRLYSLTAALATLTSLLLAYILSSFFQRSLSGPIHALVDTARAVSERDDYAARAPSSDQAELGVLTSAFNRMLERIASQSAAMHAQLVRLDLLQRTTRGIAERQDLNSIYGVILTSLEQDMPVDFGCICEYDGEVRKLTVARVGVASAAYAAPLQLRMQAVLPADEETLARCVSGVLVHEPDTAAAPLSFAQRLAAVGLRSLVAAPLVVESTVFGVLLVARRSAGAFSSGDCEFLRQLSEHVALAGHQVQLHTALQRAYDELRQSQQVILQQERLRALGQMASGVAHDINNAISPIALYTESILEREPTLSERAREQLRIVQRAIEDVAQTVAKMREFYRPRGGSDLQPVELNPLVEQALQTTRARWHDMPQERGVVIDARAELDRDARAILGAQSDIRDALTNLIFNAVDAMPDGGRLTLRTRRKAGVDGSDEGVELEVADTGVGMDEETRRRCLEPFFTTKGERGTGMGLAMVYGMARRHGAELEIESRPGEGSTVRLRFRLAAAAAVRPALAPTAGSLRPLRILLVDDDPLVLESLQRTLAAEGHRVEAAEGGQAGLERFNSISRGGDPFEIVITDLGMPFVDGRAVAAGVKKASPRTPVLLLTGWGERLLAEHTTPAHVDRVLSKPPRMAELRSALAELTAAEAAPDELDATPRRKER